jgi:tungstate transport system ATP-binding protein
VTEPILEGRDLRMDYGGATVLDVPAVAVGRGEIFALIGPNGAGKSTLLRILGLLERPTAGIVRFRGQPVPWGGRDFLATRRQFACVFQEPLLCDATVEANVALGLRLRHRPAEEVAAQVGTWLARLGIAHLAGREARTLSGGEAQRASLARAFALHPDILLLDEPFAALDPPTCAELLGQLQALLRQEGCTTVFVTHDREEALRLGDRIAVVMGGRLCQVGTPAEVFGRPASEEVARFVGMETILPGRILASRDGLLTVGVEGVCLAALGKVAVGDAVFACLRPEDITLRPAEGHAIVESARNRLEGRVESAIRLEAQYRVEIACGPRLVALVTTQSYEELGLGPGSPVVATFKASAVHLIPR